MTAMGKFLGMQQNFRKLLSSWGSIDVIDKLQVELTKFKEKRPQINDFESSYLEGAITCKNVSFSFIDRNAVLKDINLHIPANSTIALVGESGSGKSTLINILIGLLQPTRGAISIGGVPYEKINLQELRRSIGYITQENVIFNDTIYNNITLWNSKGDDTTSILEFVARKANISKFVEGLSDGYNSILGERGINISGGQRQKICIARELYKQVKILIFDEATSSLDTQSEREIQDNIDEYRGQRTIIIVAHRLSTIRNCDKIFVLKSGRIVEEGSYEKLLLLDNEFKKMVDLQNS